MNVLAKDKQGAIVTLLKNDVTQSEIYRKTGIDRKTIRKYGRERGLIPPHSKSPSGHGVATGSGENGHQNPHPRPPALPGTQSACEPHREWIEEQVRLGRNGVSIYQDLVEKHGFDHKYNSVKRFVRHLRKKDPEQYDRLEFLPGEEAQVDYGQGAKTLTKNGTYRKPRLFVMTLKYSGRCFRKVVWKSSKKIWAQLHEEAFRYFGGCPTYVVLDNLKEGVIKPDLYEPELNPLYEEVLSHYGVVADPARVCDPNRKGTVENAIKYTQNTGLKGRTFKTVEEQNQWLKHWEENWAAKRIHGRSKCQVEKRFQEEKGMLNVLPSERFRYFEQETRTVWDDGCIQVNHSYYWAGPAPISSQVMIRIYETELEIWDPKTMEKIQCHPLLKVPGSVAIKEENRIYNPSRQTRSLFNKAKKIGPYTHKLCKSWFEDQGRSSQRKIYGVVNLARHIEACYIEQAAQAALENQLTSFKALKRMASQKKKDEQKQVQTGPDTVSQEHSLIRPADAYQDFWSKFASTNSQKPTLIKPGELPLVWQNASWNRVVEIFGLKVDLKKSKKGSDLWVCSPFTNEQNASLKLNLHQNIYMDFSQGKGGGILSFCQNLLQLQGRTMSSWEVGCWMIECGISVLSPTSASPACYRSPEKEKAGSVNKPIQIDLRPYLEPNHPSIIHRQLSAETCVYLGCGFLPMNGRKVSPLNGRIVFQIRGLPVNGSQVAPILSHMGRALTAEQESSKGKYWCYPFQKGLEIYNQDQLVLDPSAREQCSKHGLVLVEGFFDVALLVEAGCLNAGALMGIKLTSNQINRLKALQEHLCFPYITLCLDRDQAGQRATHQVQKQLEQAGFFVKPFPWDLALNSPCSIPEQATDPADLGADLLRSLRQQQRI